MASSIFASFSGSTINAPIINNPTFTGQELEADGTAGAPSKSYTSEPTLGLYRSAASSVAFTGTNFYATSAAISATGFKPAQGGYIQWGSRSVLYAPADGQLNLKNNAETIGSLFKFDALPTISSGFGTSPAVIAGSTPLAGSVNVGTGGVATSGVILFNGTAFPSVPFVICTCSLGAVPTVAVATATQITFTTSIAWPASTVLNWHAISSK